MLEKTWHKGKWVTWGGRGFWAVTDQALFALSNFALNILLARWLVPEDYGAFAVAYTLFLLLGTLHTGMLTEPMQVFGPGKHQDRFGHYLYVLIKGHMAFSLLGSLLFAITALVLWRLTDSPLTAAIGGLAFALPFILFQWLLRRACYVLMTPELAARAGMVYMALMLASLFGLHFFDGLGSASALVIMGLASLFSGLWLLRKLRTSRSPFDPIELERSAIGDHWRYGRWAAASGLLSWVPGNVVFLLLPVWHGLEAAAILRALNNLVMPVLHVNAAMGMLLLPALVQARQSGSARMLRLSRNATVLFTAGGLVYWLLIGFFAEPVTSLLYGSLYADHASILWAIGLLPVAAASVMTAGALLRAMERPDWVLRAYAVSTAMSLTVGLALIWRFGLAGAVVFGILSSAVTAGLLWLYVLLDSPASPRDAPI